MRGRRGTAARGPQQGGGIVEFTVGRRLVRRARTTLAVAGAGVLVGLAWLVAGRGGGLGGPLFAVGLSLLGLWGGWRELARSREPFRLRVDDFGITLHDAELSWEQIDAVALHYPPRSDDESQPPPLLVLWPASGVALPRRPDRGQGALSAMITGGPAQVRHRYTLVRTHDLDQSVTDLAGALARHGGARFETAPRAVRTPTPLSVAGPERRTVKPEVVVTPAPPGPARTARGVAAVGLLVLGVVLLLPVADLVTSSELPFSPALFGPWFAVTAATWWLGVYTFRRWRRPLRLRVGPDGLGVREVASQEFWVPWDAVAAVTVGPAPGTTDARLWLIVWPVPGAALARDGSHVVDGHVAHVLVRLDRLPGGAQDIGPLVQSFAGERFSA